MLAQSVDPAEKKLAGAEGLLARGQYDMARQEFDEFLRTFPRAPQTTRAQYGKALCAYHAGNLATAAAELEAVIADKTFAHRDEALAVLAAVYLSAGDPQKSLVASAALLKDHPASPQIESVMVNRAQALYRLGRYDESLAQTAAMLKVYPTSPHRAAALYVAALDQRAMSNDAAAATLLQEIAAKFPNAPFVYDARIMIGETLAGQAKFDDAIAYLTGLRSEAPDSRKPAIDFALGTTLSRAGKYDQAQKTFDTLAASNKDSPYAGQAQLQKAVAQLKAGQRNEARQSLALVAREHPELASSATYWTARCDILEGKPAEAKATLTRLAELKPAPVETPEILFDLAYTELMTGQDAKAIERLASFRAAYPYSAHDIEALYYQATALHHLGEFAKSAALCEQIAKRPGTPLTRPASILKAENLLMQKAYTDADGLLAALQTTATDASEKLRLALRRAQCAYFSGDYKTAEAHLTPYVTATSKDPLQAEAIFLLADAQLQESKYAAAMASFKSYLADDSAAHAHEATYKLALAQLGAKDAKAASATLAELAKADIHSVWVQRSILERAQLAYDDKSFPEAERTIAGLLAASPAEAVAAPAEYLLARIEMDTGRYAQAAAQLAAIAEKYPKNALAEDAVFARGAALKQAGKSGEAVAQFDTYIRLYPKGRLVTQAWQQGAVALTAAGKPAEAVKILTQLAADAATRSDAVLYDLAWAQRSAGDPSAAAGTYRSILKEFPAAPRAAPAKVELAELSTDKPADAAGLLTAALKDPGLDAKLRAVAIYRLGQTYLRMDEAAKAAEAFDAFVSENPKDPLLPAALCEAGAAQLKAGRLDEAKRRLNRVLSEFPKSEAANLALIRLGDTQNQAGEYAVAAATFTRFLADHAADPLAPQAHLGLGWSLENRSQFAEARDQYGKVTAADNSAVGARAQFQIGETYFAQKQFDLAAKELLKVDIQYHAAEWSARALYEAGRAFEQLHDPGSARRQYQDCLKKYAASDVAPLARKRMEALP